MITHENMNEHVSMLLSTRLWCYWVPADGYVENYGYRVSIVNTE